MITKEQSHRILEDLQRISMVMGLAESINEVLREELSQLGKDMQGMIEANEKGGESCDSK